MTAKLGLTNGRQDRRPRRQRHRVGRGLPGDRRGAADAHPDDGRSASTTSPRCASRARRWSPTTPPIGAYRGAGRPEATQLIERVLDVAADQLGIDPAEIRRRNFLDPADFPLTTTDRRRLRLRRVRQGPRRRPRWPPATTSCGPSRPRRRAAGDPMQLGIGVSTYVEVTAPLGLHIEFGAVEVHDDGTRQRWSSAPASHGQGHHTAFAMVASDVLGIPMDKITLVNSDTAAVPRGAGTHGLPLAADGRQRRARRLQGGARPGPADRRPPARGQPRRHRRRRAAASTWPACPAERVSWAELAVASRDAGQAARRARARPAAPRARLRRHRLDLPVRRPRLGRRGRHRDRPGDDAAPHRGRRLRAHPQPAARRAASSTAASPRARPRRCSSGCSTTPTATRSRPT